jgi:predicted methyltransferase
MPHVHRIARWFALLSLALACLAARASSPADSAFLDQAIAGTHRSDANRARDPYRHPRETLLFFGLRPDLHVVEVWPGAGWYTEILAPALRNRGKLYAGHVHVDETTHRFYRTARERFVAKLEALPAVYDRVAITAIFPPHAALAPPASVDLVLTFRNVHNWSEAGFDAAMFQAFHEVLKPGGVLGVVEHRAAEGTHLRDMIRTGYMTESHVIGLATRAGFRLEARSEVNANPRDTRDHPRGVWSLPPTFRMGDQDRDRYAAIGESDRMTLKFVKP